MRRKVKGSAQHHPIAQFKLRSLTYGAERASFIHDQCEVVHRFVESLNEAMSKELGSLVTALEGRLAARNDELIVEVVSVVPAQMRFDWDASGSNFDVNPNALKERARTEWASALRSALLNEEAIRHELPGLATAATRIRSSEVDTRTGLMDPAHAVYIAHRNVPGEVSHASQGTTEFDLSRDFALPVWDAKCTIRAKPSLGRNGVVMELIKAPLGYIGRTARAHIDDVPAACFQVIAGVVKRRGAIDLEVQLAKSPTRAKHVLCKVHDVIVMM